MSPGASGCCSSEVALMLLHLNAEPPATSASMAVSGKRASGLMACDAPSLTLPASANRGILLRLGVSVSPQHLAELRGLSMGKRCPRVRHRLWLKWSSTVAGHAHSVGWPNR
eukprot:2723521-Rhodomonas_salina.1